MWLDRFANHSTPAPAPQREPRAGLVSRPSTQYQRGPRPGLNPRDSTFSLLSNGSTTNLPTLPKGSSLRNRVDAAPTEDPLTALEAIIGRVLDNAKNITAEGVEQDAEDGPGELLEDIDFEGLSLADFAAKDNTKHDARDVPTYLAQSVDEYDKEKDKLKDLHKSIAECDGVLKSVETYLTSFQSDLSAVSAEIETLQSRSSALNSKLENRQKVEKLLGPLVEAITLSPRVVSKISDGAIDEGWIKALEDLTNRTKALEKNAEGESSKFLEDLKPMMEKLSDRAVERIRDHFVAQIKAIRNPSANAQIIQQNQFLKYQSLFAFLATRQPQLASELMQAYGNTMRWYYSSHFARYEAALSRLPLYVTTNKQLLGEDTSKIHANHDPFNLGRRIEILQSRSTTAIPSHLAETSTTTVNQKSPTHYYIETPFHSLNLALIDNASFEYTFLSHFLPAPPHRLPTPTLNTLFTHIFTPTFTLAQAVTRRLASPDTYDALGILLCLRLTQHSAFLAQRRKIPLLEPHTNATAMHLWPRFQSILDAHTDSLRRLTAALPTRAAASTLSASSLLGNSASSVSTAPHPLTQRFAAFVSGVLALSAEAGDDEPVARSLARLKGEFEAFLARMSMGFGGGERGKRERERFLTNQYSLLVAVTGDAGGRLAEEVRAGWRVAAGLGGEGEEVV